MANIFAGTEPPRWLENIATPVTQQETDRAVGMINSLISGIGKQASGEMSFRDAFTQAQWSQSDPLWAIKVKHMQAQEEMWKTQAQAKWMEADRKTQDAIWLQESMQSVEGRKPDDPIPSGLHPKVADALLKQKSEADSIEIKRQLLDLQNQKALDALQKERDRLNAPQSPIGKLQSDRAAALSRGDSEAVRQLDAAIEESTSNKGRSIYMGQDDQGRPIFQMTEGGAKSVGPPTVAMQTKAQEHLAQYRNALQTMDMLKVTPEMVGVMGQAGEWVIDRGLAQLTGKSEGTRVQGRTLMRLLKEGVLKQVSDTSRYSQQDREEIAQIFPSTGWFESADRANKAVAQIKEVFKNRAKVYARSINQKPPPWSLSDSELKQEYPSPQDIKDLMDKHTISYEEALDALVRGGYQ